MCQLININRFHLIHFRCPYMAVQEAEDDEDVAEDSIDIENEVLND